MFAHEDLLPTIEFIFLDGFGCSKRAPSLKAPYEHDEERPQTNAKEGTRQHRVPNRAEEKAQQYRWHDDHETSELRTQDDHRSSARGLTGAVSREFFETDSLSSSGHKESLFVP
jgi:hypothetical protein